MYAVIETGGKQYRVQEGDIITIEKLGLEAGETVTFDKVLVLSDDEGTKIGAPYVEGAKVIAEVVENGKAKKVIIFKYKSKKDYRKKQGHRQPYTMVEIKDLGGVCKKEEAPAEAEAAEEVEVIEEVNVAEAVETAEETVAVEEAAETEIAEN